MARTNKWHLDGLLRYVQHATTKGVNKGINSKIMSIDRNAGFRKPLDITTTCRVLISYRYQFRPAVEGLRPWST